MNKGATGTVAHDTFVCNIARLWSLETHLAEGLKAMAKVAGDRHKLLQSKIIAALRGDLTPLTEDEQRDMDESPERVARADIAHALVSEWIAVVLVTFTEAYLEDALAACAARDPELMSKSEQSIGYADVRAAGSVEELLDEIRHRWARNFVDDGGPARWIKRLERMGARGYESTDVESLEELWGIRHVVVHAAGRVTRDFVRRHPRLGYQVGSQLDLSEDTSSLYDQVVFRFVDVTDSFFVRRYFTENQEPTDPNSD